jgi:capsular polysaccharide biosynthesis protein
LILLKSLNVEIDFFIIPDSSHWTISGLTALFPNAKFVTYKSSHHYVYQNLFYFNDFSNEGLFDSRMQVLLSETIYKYFIFPFKLNLSQQHKKIFLSRSASSLDKPKYRPLTNEAALESIAIDNGYQVIYPEQYSLARQYQIIGEAHTIITISGSNCYPLLFNSNKPKVLHLESFTQTVRQAYKIFASASCEYHGLFGKIHNPSQPIWSSWEVDPSVFSFALSNLCD